MHISFKVKISNKYAPTFDKTSAIVDIVLFSCDGGLDYAAAQCLCHPCPDPSMAGCRKDGSRNYAALPTVLPLRCSTMYSMQCTIAHHLDAALKFIKPLICLASAVYSVPRFYPLKALIDQ